MATAEATGVETDKAQPWRAKSCKDCGHVKVCVIPRALAPLLEKNWTPETKPFDADDVAAICKRFVSAQLLRTLNHQEAK